ncbi:MAG: hypothetical protein M3N68_05140 [Actinomycetota bacterium]|nr:hypothetical protein [Actinomycetota bacterium]
MDAGPDGRGQVRATVTLDRAAAEQVPDLARQQRVEDLEAAGWRVEEPERDEDGSVEVRAVKAFSSAAGATRAVEELTGPDGAFRQFALTRTRTFLKTRTRFSGTVDLSRGLEGFIDPVLRERLGGSGLDSATVERQLGAPLAQVFTFEVRADLPGEVAGNAPGGRAVWEPKLGQTMALEASAEQWNVLALASAVTAVVSGAALLVVLVRRSRTVSWS